MYNYGYMRQPLQPSLEQAYPILKGHPVSSIEEVRAAHIDFDGSLFIFPDLAHNRIYTKAIGMDGSASLNMYELSKIPNSNPTINTENFVTREEFDNAVAQLKEALNQSSPSKDEKPQFNF